MTTEERIALMLVENTGRHFLDSGGESGRAWQRNRALVGMSNESFGYADLVKGFKAKPATHLEINKYGISITHDVFHWLCERLDYSEEADAKFQRWMAMYEAMHGQQHWLPLMEMYADRMVKKYEGGGIYGEGEPIAINTYNGEDLLSQTLQYTYFTKGERGDREEVVLLQINGGADVRGGYTRPRLFTLDQNHEMGIMDNAKASLWCDGTDQHTWYTDDGHCFNGSNREPRIYHPEFRSLEGEREEFKLECSDTDVVKHILERIRADDEPLTIPYNEESVGYCPVCGGILDAGAY